MATTRPAWVPLVALTAPSLVLLLLSLVLNSQLSALAGFLIGCLFPPYARHFLSRKPQDAKQEAKA